MARHTDTRERVLETAAGLFQRQGFSATGLTQVLSESSAPKGSLYFHFPGGKEQLAAESVSLSGARMGAEMTAVVRAAETPEAAISGLADLFAGNLNGSDFHSGCPVATVALEAAADSETIRASCDGVYDSWKAGLARALRYWGVAAEETGPLAELIISSLQGAILLAKVRKDTTVIHTVAGQLAAQVKRSIHRSTR